MKAMKKRSIQYLLSADQKLRRLSLKRLSTRITAAKPTHRSTGLPKVRRPKGYVVSPAIGTASVLAVMVVIAAGALPAARQAFLQASHQADGDVVSPAVTVGTRSEATAPVGDSANKKTVPPTTSAAVVAVKTDTPSRFVELKPVSDTTMPGRAPMDAPNRGRHEAASVPAKDANASTKELASKSFTVPSASSTGTSGTEQPEAVTVSGCLEASDAGFRLKDTSGVDALKSRSWKSVFLKKHSPAIEMVAAAGTLQLPSYVGQRVSATGTLVDRQMRASSVQTLSSSCR